VLNDLQKWEREKENSLFFLLLQNLGQDLAEYHDKYRHYSDRQGSPRAPKKFSASVVATALAAIFTTLFQSG
jgi:hypothetical protein